MLLPSQRRWPQVYFSQLVGQARPWEGRGRGERSCSHCPEAVTAPDPGFSFLNLNFSGSKIFLLL